MKLTSLTISEIAVQPYEYYEETIQDGSLRIEAKAVLTNTQHHQLKAIQKTGDLYPIIRHGIDENPKQMKLEPDYWSQMDLEYKHRLLLIEGSEDNKPDQFASAFRWMKTIRSQVAFNIAIMDMLLATLVNRKFLTEIEVNDIYKAAREHSWDDLYEFFRVDDLDEL